MSRRNAAKTAHGRGASLFASCAVGMALTALAFAPKAKAQFLGTPNVVSGTVTGETTSFIEINSDTALINWTPTDNATNAGVPIVFLGSSSSVTFQRFNNQSFTVLNRIIPTDTSRPIQFDGTVNSRIFDVSNSAPGGNVWFYSPGGIIASSTSVFDVGGLVLTANDILTTGGLFGTNGEIRFSGAADSQASVLVDFGAQIRALSANSYVALVAPRVEQRGLVDVNGSVAYVAAEQADITINSGLFDINIITGTTVADALTHIGDTGGPAPGVGAPYAQRIYMAAVPKNTAITMLVGGTLGFDAAAAFLENGTVVLSSGYDIENGEIGQTVQGTGAANIRIGDATIKSDVVAKAANDLLASPFRDGSLAFERSANLTGMQSATLAVNLSESLTVGGSMTLLSPGGTARVVADNAITEFGYGTAAGTLFITGDLTIDASAGGINTSAPGGIGGNATGGLAELIVDGASLTVNGAANVLSNGVGGFGAQTGGNGTGGTARLQVLSGTANFTGVSVTADGSGNGGGSPNPATANGGNGTGGTAEILIDGGELNATTVNVNANGTGGGDFSLPLASAGDGNGGTAQVIKSGGAQTIETLQLNAAGRGGVGASGGSAGDATGGDVLIQVTNGTLNPQYLYFDNSATAGAADVGGADGNATGAGHSAQVIVDGSDAVLDVESQFFGQSSSYSFGAGNAPSTITGGNIVVSARNGGTITSTGSVQFNASAGTSPGQFGYPDVGPDAFGGTIMVGSDGGTIDLEYLSLSAGGFAGAANITAGNGQGGDITLYAENAGILGIRSELTIAADGQGGSGESAGSGTGGSILLYAQNGTLDLSTANLNLLQASATAGAGSSGDVGSGTGGTIDIEARAGGVLDLGSLTTQANGDALLLQEEGTYSFGNGGAGIGGRTTISVLGGTMTASAIFVDASGVGGAAAASDTSTVYTGGEGRGGTAEFVMSSGTATIGTLFLSANAIGGQALDAEPGADQVGIGGIGQGGSAEVRLSGGLLNANDVLIRAGGTGGAGGNTSDIGDAGLGGAGFGGNALFSTLGDFFEISRLELGASGTGGVGGYNGTLEDFGYGTLFTPGPGRGGNGGTGTGGAATLAIDFDPVINDLLIDARGEGGGGGAGAIGGNGGDGFGGVNTGTTGGARIDLAFGELTVNNASILSNGRGGNGGQGFSGAGGNGGNGTGGDALIRVEGTDSILTLAPDYETHDALIEASGTGGNGGLAGQSMLGGSAGGNGGFGQGGNASFQILGGATVIAGPNVDIRADAFGGNGEAGTNGFVGGTGGNGGDALAGNATLTIDGSTLDLFDVDRELNWTISANATGGSGGSGGNGNDSGATGGGGGNGGQAEGGIAAFNATNATYSFGTLRISASGRGGNAGLGGVTPGSPGNPSNIPPVPPTPSGFGPNGIAGNGTGGTARFVNTGTQAAAGDRFVQTLLLDATGVGGAIDDVLSGSSIGGNAVLTDATTDPTGAVTIGDLFASSEGLGGAPGTGFVLTTAANALNILGTADIRTGNDAVFDVTGGGTFAVGGTLSVFAGNSISVTHAGQSATTPVATISAGDATFETPGTFQSEPGSFIATTGTLAVDAGTIAADGLEAGGAMTLLARTGNLNAAELAAGGDLDLESTLGNIVVSTDIVSGGELRAFGSDITLNARNALTLTEAVSSAGNLAVRAGGALTVDDATATGTIALTSTNAGVSAGTVAAGGALTVTALGNANFADLATGTTIAVNSGNISFGSAGQLGTAGTTTQVTLTNTDTNRPTFVGGADVTTGYSLSADEMTRIFSNNITIIASRVASQSSGSVGSTRAPDVIVGAFTLTSRAGSPSGNLGAQGTLRIQTPGKLRVNGAVALTGLGDQNRFEIEATEALEVIAGSGSIDMRGGNALAGTLVLTSDDIIAASQAAITDVAAATTTRAIDTRLGTNDGAASDDGYLRAGGIQVNVRNGFYVQNSGASDAFADRRGLTVGTGGLNIGTQSSATRIVINARQASATGAFVTGLDFLPIAQINGQTGATTGFDPRSTINGCLIIGGICGAPPEPERPEFELPRDLFEDAIDPEDQSSARGNLFPTTLIELDDFEPFGFEPLIDEPVTGAGNDDLWIPPCESGDGDCDQPPAQ